MRWNFQEYWPGMPHKKYLRTQVWADLRSKVVRRDRYTCQHCGSKEDLNVHHQSYPKILGTESIDTLITLCRECHTEEHARLSAAGKPLYPPKGRNKKPERATYPPEYEKLRRWEAALVMFPKLWDPETAREHDPNLHRIVSPHFLKLLNSGLVHHYAGKGPWGYKVSARGHREIESILARLEKKAARKAALAKAHPLA